MKIMKKILMMKAHKKIDINLEDEIIKKTQEPAGKTIIKESAQGAIAFASFMSYCW